MGTLYPLADMQSQAFKMNPNKDFLKAKQALSFNNYLLRYEERIPFPDGRAGHWKIRVTENDDRRLFFI